MKFRKASRLAALVFAAADWRWGAGKGYIPSQKEIKGTMKRLYGGCPEGTVESGRLLVVRQEDETKLCLVLASEFDNALS